MDQLTYRLVEPAGFGQVVPAEFTQADLTNQADYPTYTHDGSQVPVAGSVDRFRFVVSDGIATTGAFDFIINLEAVNDGPMRVSSSMVLLEDANPTPLVGSLVWTDPDGLDSALRYTVRSAPSHGTLRRNGGDLLIGSQFTQAELIGVTYQPTGTHSRQ